MSRPQRTEKQTRDAVARAAVDHVAEHGIPATPAFPMEQIIASAGISRASAYRIWPGRDAFSAFVLAECAAGHAIATLTPDQVRRIADEALSVKGDAVTRAGHFVASSADAEVTLLLSSARWRAFVAFQAVAAAGAAPAVRDEVAAADAEDIARLTATYEQIAEAWGLEPIDGADALSDLAYAAMVQLRTAVASIIGGADQPLARRRLRAALQALVRGTFRAKPGGKVTARSVRRAIATITADGDQNGA